jgi:hypothetical protein
MRDKTLLFTINKRVFFAWRAAQDRLISFSRPLGMGTVDLLGVGLVDVRLLKRQGAANFLSVQREGGPWSSGRGDGFASGLPGSGALGAHLPCLF